MNSAGAVAVGNPDIVPYDLVVVRTRVSPWLRSAGRLRRHRAGCRPLRRRGPALRRPCCPPAPPSTWSCPATRCAGAGTRSARPAPGPPPADGLLVSPGGAHRPVRVRVYPETEPFEAVEAMPRGRRAGRRAPLAAARRGRRAGRGTAVRARGPAAPHRLAGVAADPANCTWPPPCPTGTPRWCVLLDVLAEAGRSGGVAGAASVLDTTVRAAAAIAEHYLHRGDRVSLLEYGPAARRLRPATGRRQYLTVLEWLLDVRADVVRRTSRTTRSSAPHLLSVGRAGGGAHPAARRAVRADAGPAGPGRPVRGGGGHPADRSARPPRRPGLGAGGVPAVAAGPGER